MASSDASLVLRRAVCRSFPSLTPICRPRCFSTRNSSSVRVLTSRTIVWPCPAISVRHASSSTSKALNPDDLIKRADKNLLCVLETEIEDTEDSDDGPTQQEVALPEDCPFEIVDNPGDYYILLKREFQGENIEVCAFLNLGRREKGDDEAGDKGKCVAQPTVCLVVTINKGEGTALEFTCILVSEGLEFEFESMVLKMRGGVDYGGPDFMDMDVSLAKALRKYLVARGIKPSLYTFLADYLINKDVKEQGNWLKSMKEFVAK